MIGHAVEGCGQVVELIRAPTGNRFGVPSFGQLAGCRRQLTKRPGQTPGEQRRDCRRKKRGSPAGYQQSGQVTAEIVARDQVRAGDDHGALTGPTGGEDDLAAGDLGLAVGGAVAAQAGCVFGREQRRRLCQAQYGHGTRARRATGRSATEPGRTGASGTQCPPLGFSFAVLGSPQQRLLGGDRVGLPLDVVADRLPHRIASEDYPERQGRADGQQNYAEDRQKQPRFQGMVH
ncbi:MAG TPA: hypothetical protein VKU40_14765 [Thermoanaerobaculia bacterium]|nr:hypothetical protein [Thermoanaerobaculia bacterium]